jgi:hypothetical protein
MPILKTRRLFISHAWSYDSHYNTLVSWLNEEPNFDWINYSVPSSDCCDEKTTAGLTRCMTRQINPAQGIIILAGMYVCHSGWIDYEIDEAVRLGKTIIGVRPWGQERVPVKVQDSANVMVYWNRASIIQAIRDYI